MITSQLKNGISKKKLLTGKTDWRFAVLFSATLTVFTMIDKNTNNHNASWIDVVMTWIIIFLFLLLNWYVNSNIQINFGNIRSNGLSIKRILLVLVCNLLLLVGLMVCLLPFVFGINFGSMDKNIFGIVTYRGIVGISLLYIIQTALNSNTRAQEILLQNQMLKTENVRSQLEILKQQISPHFLFNSLATLRAMIRSGNANSEQYVIKLSEIYRQLLIKRQLDIVTLDEEMHFVHDYLYMIQARFGEALKITIDLPEHYMTRQLPTFSMQLLLENCMKHNIATAERPLRIQIVAGTADTIVVENNLQTKISHADKSGYGLENLDQRYNLLGWPDSVAVYMDEQMFRVELKLLSI